MKRSRETIDFSTYLRAFGVFARNPTVIVMPLLAGVIGIAVGQFADFGAGGLLASITTFLVLLIQLFALGVSIIIADQGWRRGQASFDDAWQDARRKGRDLLFAAFGLTFVINIAQYIGQILGNGIIGIVLLALAAYFLIFTIAAAAIGGIPGGAAINVSIERVRSAPMSAALLAVVSLVLMYYVGSFIEAPLFAALGVTSPLIGSLIGVVVQSVLTGYIAVVTAKVYSDVSFTMPRW